MTVRAINSSPQVVRKHIVILCAVSLLHGDPGLWALSHQETSPSQETTIQQEAAAKLPPEELDSLVAPIALYPDPLLSQTLVASTYPLEIIQLQQWLEKHKGLKDKALTDAVTKENWDPSIQAMAVLPDVVKRLAENIKWTTDLGNAFLAQQSDVMDAVQRMRSKAREKGNLESGEQQKVEIKTVENKQVIVIEPSSPDVVYVPSYNPTVVYGAPVYAYPPIYYPPPGYYAAGMAISFGVGMAVGAAWGGGWGWGCGWGHNDIQINNYNNFNRNANVNRNVGVNRGRNSTWQHNPQHRGGAPYSNRATANRYGGTARGESLQNRQANARQQASARSAGGVDRGNARQQASARSTGGADRGAGGAGSMNRGSQGGGDRIGNRSVPSTPSARSSSAFGAGGSSGRAARASSSRGSSSMGSRGGGRGGGRRR